MNTTSSKAPKETKVLDRHTLLDADGFDVVVQQSIGRVEFEGGDRDPTVVAFELIGAHVSRESMPGDSQQYEFPGPHGMVHVQVQVES